MKWITYLLEANLYLAALYLFYRLLLQRETFYQLNRWYFIAALVVSFSLPLLKVQQNSAPVPDAQTRIIDVTDLNSTPQINATKDSKSSGSLAIKYLKTAQGNWRTFLLSLYVFVAILCLIKLAFGVKKIVVLYLNSHRYKEGKVTHVYLNQEHEAFSFFNWLFYHPDIKPAKAIIRHEMIHINQRHSYDILLIELFQVINWFNPLIYLMRKDMKLNHEYLADQDACKETVNRHEYAVLLINYSTNSNSLALTNPIFNGEQLKQRIKRLKKTDAKKHRVLKYLLLLPLLIILSFISAFTVPKSYGYISVRSSFFTKQAVLKPNERKTKEIYFQPGIQVDTNLNVHKIGTKFSQKKNSTALDTNTIVKNNKQLNIPLNDAHQQRQVSLNRQASDTSKVFFVQPVINGGQVTINRSTSDTVHSYTVQPVYFNGQQVSINRARVD
jgi:hypothetical protein